MGDICWPDAASYGQVKADTNPLAASGGRANASLPLSGDP